MRSFALLAPGALLLLAVLAGPAGCGPRRPSPEEGAAAGRAAADRAEDAEWLWLQKAEQRLGQKRAELAQERSRPASAAAEKVRQLQKEVDDLSAELGRRLVDLINSDPPVVGQPLTERQKRAIRMKSAEDIQIGRDFIERGGDYRRAIEIYEAALAVDPDNPRLKEELDRARGERYMTAERFAQLKEGMDEDEVRALLGQPNRHNVRDFADKDVSAWFYPKDPGGAAAAVYFETGRGKAKVYAFDFEAVSPASPPARPRRPGPAAPAAPAGPRPSSET